MPDLKLEPFEDLLLCTLPPQVQTPAGLHLSLVRAVLAQAVQQFFDTTPGYGCVVMDQKWLISSNPATFDDWDPPHVCAKCYEARDLAKEKAGEGEIVAICTVTMRETVEDVRRVEGGVSITLDSDGILIMMAG